MSLIAVKKIAKKIIKPIDEKFNLGIINNFGQKTIENLSTLTQECLKYISDNNVKVHKKILWPTPFTLSKTWWAHDGLWINALRIRGVEVIPTMCDVLQSEECVFYSGYWKDTSIETKGLSRERICNNCKKNDLEFWEVMKLNPIKLNSFITAEEKKELKILAENMANQEWKEIKYDNYGAGFEAWKAVVNNDLQAEINKNEPERAKRLFISHLQNIYYLHTAYSRILNNFKPDAIFGNGGFYYFWGVLGHLSKNQDIPYYRYYPLGIQAMSWNYALNSNEVVDFTPGWNSWIKQKFDKKMDTRVLNDLASRGLKLLFTNEEKTLFRKHVTSDYNISNEKPIYLLLTGVAWDAATNIKAKAFDNMYDWAFKTIEWAKNNPEINLVVRVHPSENLVPEVGKNVRTTFIQELNKRQITVSDNVKIINFDEKVNTYDLLAIADVGLTYASTTGLEFACQGKPIAIIAECHYAHKGFTFTPQNPKEYFDYLNLNKDTKISQENIAKKAELARKYWYFYAFHASVKLSFFELSQKDLLGVKRGTVIFESELKKTSVSEIAPGENELIDYVCDSIINNLPLYGENRWPPDNHVVGV